MKNTNLICKVRSFLTGEKVPYSSITPFEEFPSETELAISRISQHEQLAKASGNPWTKVATKDLRLILIKILKREFEDIIDQIDSEARNQ